MPVYEYKCKNGHEATRIVPVSELQDEFVCPQCRKSQRQENGPHGYRAVRMVLQVSLTGKPRFIGGGAGGFYNPTT